VTLTIKSVTTENIAQFVADRQAAGSEVKTPEQVAALEGKDESRIVGTGTETVSTAPDPGEQTPTAAKLEAEPEEDDEKAPKWYRARLKQLSQEKKDLEELAREEYETRMALQGKLKEAEAVKPQPQADTRPDRTKYKAEEADKYEDDLLSWNRRQTKRELEQESYQKRIEDNIRASKEAARKEFSDFDAVAQRAARRDIKLPSYINAAIGESQYGAHLVYHLNTHPEDEAEILSLPPATALLRLGEIQTQLKRKATEEVAAAPAPKIPPVTRAPPPLPAVGSGAGNIAVDLSGSIPFKQYQRQRLEQKAKARRGAH
jgi:hypothetical protein